MKRIALMLILLALVLLPISACAQALPDLAASLQLAGEKQFADYAYSADYICDVWVFNRNTQTDAQCGQWLLECIESGFLVMKTEVDGFPAYRAEDSDGLCALLFPEYSGAVMLMVQQGMDYSPAEPAAFAPPETAPSALPETTFSPAEQQSIFSFNSYSGGHWERVATEKDCTACVGGVCRLCDGTGIYKMYGASHACPTLCQTCEGKGTRTIYQTILVYD